MKVVVLGCSRVGAVLAAWLAQNKHEVTVIDWEYNSFRRLPQDLEIKQIMGSGVDREVLQRAGIEKSDAFVAVTNSDNTNLMSAQVVKNKFNVSKVIARVYDPNRANVLIAATGADQDNLIICQTAKILYLIPKTIARVNDPKNEELFQTLGVDATVSSTRIIGSLIEEKIDPGMAIPLMALKGEVEIFQTELEADSPLMQKKLSKLKLPEDVIIFAAIRGNEVIIPKGDTVFEEGDKILALTKKEGKEEFRKLFL